VHHRLVVAHELDDAVLRRVELPPQLPRLVARGLEPPGQRRWVVWVRIVGDEKGVEKPAWASAGGCRGVAVLLRGAHQLLHHTQLLLLLLVLLLLCAMTAWRRCGRYCAHVGPGVQWRRRGHSSCRWDG
jgi:hypothetical protein